MKGKSILLFAVFLFVILLGGCGMRTVDEMYSLPRRSSEYSNLQSAIDTSMTGMEYAAPVSGDNRQSVQTADLDGDGTEEYIVFAKSGGDNPLRILIFQFQADGKYQLKESLTCKGAAFEQIQYVEMDGSPGLELVAGRRINDQVTRIASVYSFADGHAEQILSTIYNKFITCDLDENGLSELMVIRNGDAETGNAVSVLYGCPAGIVERSVETVLSETAEHVRRIAVNKLYSGEKAIYISSTRSDSDVVTDVLTLKKGDYTNISMLTFAGESVHTLSNYAVYAEDIDGDGCFELPWLESMRDASETDNRREQKLIRWYGLDINGRKNDKCITFHNFADGWYLDLRSNWVTRIAAEEKGNVYTFYLWNENYGEAMAVFSIYTFTGKDRDSLAAEQNRFALYRGENAVYAAKLEFASAIYGISEKDLINSFHLIRQDWKTGET